MRRKKVTRSPETKKPKMPDQSSGRTPGVSIKGSEKTKLVLSCQNNLVISLERQNTDACIDKLVAGKKNAKPRFYPLGGRGKTPHFHSKQGTETPDHRLPIS